MKITRCWRLSRSLLCFASRSRLCWWLALRGYGCSFGVASGWYKFGLFSIIVSFCFQEKLEYIIVYRIFVLFRSTCGLVYMVINQLIVIVDNANTATTVAVVFSVLLLIIAVVLFIGKGCRLQVWRTVNNRYVFYFRIRINWTMGFGRNQEFRWATHRNSKNAICYTSLNELEVISSSFVQMVRTFKDIYLKLYDGISFR